MKLQAHDLACVRGARKVFDSLDFTAPGGTGVAVTGPNGAGKSSLLRILAGFIEPAGGEIRFEGGEPDTPRAAQSHFVGHLSGVRKALSVAENLAFWGDFYGGGGDVEGALAAFGLDAIADSSAGLLSAGQVRRLGLARLVLAPRPVWLLDEPGVSLDAASLKTLATVIRDHLEGGGIVIAATHAALGVKFAKQVKLGEAGK